MVDQASERRRTAIHEAGHAVAKVRCGLELGVVRIDLHDGRLGTVSGDGDPSLSAEGAENEALVALTGYAALAAIGEPAANSGCDDDFEKAQETIDFWALPGSLDDWKHRSLQKMW